jgi:glyoxylase-like metal-dependent hydrolase (beta-lactamase superfamily II)
MSISWQIIPTGRVWVDPGGPFGLVPRSLWSQYYTTDDGGLVAMDLNSLLVQSGGHTILVDNGLGDKLSEKAAGNWHLEYPEGTLNENLARQGLTPADIDIMIDTHLHADHCGGNTTLVDGIPQPAFPNARYYVQKREYDEATHTNVRTRNTYLPENFLPVFEAGQFELLDGNAEIAPGVRVAVVPGHTKGIQAVIVEDDGGPLIFISDLATFSVHLTRTAWVTAYDVYPLETIGTKEKWQPWIVDNKARVIFQHDVHTRLARMTTNEKGQYELEVMEPGSMPK